MASREEAYGFSTLERCRTIENQNRVDAGEATLDYASGTISGSLDDPEVREVAERTGIGSVIGIVPGQKWVITIEGNHMVERFPMRIFSASRWLTTRH